LSNKRHQRRGRAHCLNGASFDRAGEFFSTSASRINEIANTIAISKTAFRKSAKTLQDEQQLPAVPQLWQPPPS
jgi:hypothetical protein